MKQLKLLSLLVVVLLLTGCLSPMVRFTIDPNPIIIEYGDEDLKDVTLKFKTSGFGRNYKIDTALIEIKDKDGTELLPKKTENLGLTITVVPFVKKDVKLAPIDLKNIANIEPKELYDEHLKNKEFVLIVTLDGTNTSTAEAKVVFK